MTFTKYQKKPIQVEAIQFTEETKDQVFNSITGNVAADFEDGKPVIKFMTIHGDIAVARLGDWIVKDGIIGTYYPVKPDIFEKTYEVVE